MKSINVAEDILPIGEFKTHASAVLRRIRSTGRPVVVTQNGRAAAVVMSAEEYESLSQRAQFIDRVNQGIAEADAGHVFDDEEVMKAVESQLVAQVARRKARKA
jgi:prevent-host-death family protein